MVSATVLAITSRFIPTPVMKRMLRPMVHTCAGIEWDLDGPSPSEYCKACQRAMSAHSSSCTIVPPTITTGGSSIDWDTEWARRSVEADLIRDNDISTLMEHDLWASIERPWWYYAEMHDAKYGEAEREADSLEKYRRELEETQAREEAIKRDLRAYVSSQDPREARVREAELSSWLATPKNRRPIVLANGRTMPGVAKADTGSVVIKKCPTEVALSDITTIMAKFGGVRDVYRPVDRATGAPKPFVFVEMLRNQDAWAAADYFTVTPCVLDGRTLSVEGAGERKTAADMIAAVGFVPPTAVTATPATPAKAKPAAASGAFAALADSDTDSDLE